MRSVLMLTACAGMIFGQTNPQDRTGPRAQTLPLSLKRAVEIALTPEGNPRIAIAQESIKVAESRRTQAFGALLPDLESSLVDRRQTNNLKAFGFNFAIPIPGFSIPNIVGPYSVFDARATATQTVFDFSVLKRYQVSKVNVLAANADFDTAQNQVGEQVARAYATALRTDAALDKARANVELSDALLKLAQQTLTAGTGTGIEVTRAQVQLTNDKQHVIVAENDRRRAGLNLLKAMGLRMDANVELTDKLSFKPEDQGTLEGALSAAKQTRPELKAQDDREKSAKLNYGAVRAERIPSVGASADYGTIGSKPIGASPTYTYALSVKVPLFDGGRRDARRSESLAQFRQEKSRTRDLQDQVELDVRLAFDSVRSAASEVSTAQEGIRLAQEELAAAQRRYQAGITNSIEVTDAQTRLDRARENQISALYDHTIARIDLATATGRIREFVNQ